MHIKIGEFEFTECWDGVLYKKLSNYPDISEWEIQTIYDFLKYESDNGRESDIEADAALLKAIENYKPIYESGVRVPTPEKITECTACPRYKGCMTDLVCHTTSISDAKSILSCGSLLSAVRARSKTAQELKHESRNAANDTGNHDSHTAFNIQY